MASVLAEIVTWAREQAAWQGDILRRLFLQGEFTSNDEDAIYGMMLASKSVPGVTANEPVSIGLEHIPSDAGAVVGRITAVKNLQNVNRIDPEQELPFQATGLTVIFGRNGVGKSGYTRVIKKACRARAVEPIRGDVYAVADGHASAEFVIEADDGSEIIQWRDDVAADERLSSIAVFDTSCARSITNDEGSLLFQPYGANLLVELGGVLNQLQERCKREEIALSKAHEKMPDLPPKSNAAELAKNLEEPERRREFLDQAKMSAAEKDELKKLKEQFEGDPVVQAEALTLRAQRLDKDIKALEQMQALVGDGAWQDLRASVNSAAATAKKVREAAAHLKAGVTFDETGSPAWLAMMNQVRKFMDSDDACPVTHDLTALDSCPVCQQPLDAHRDRFVEFLEFVDGDLQSQAKQAAEALKIKLGLIEKKWPDASFDEERRTEVSMLDVELANEVDQHCSHLAERRAAALEIDLENPQVADGRDRHSTCVDDLRIHSATLKEQATELHKASDAEERSRRQKRMDDLLAKEILTENGAAVKDIVDDIAKCVAVRELKRECSTATVSKLSKEIVEKRSTKALADALDKELKALDVDKLAVVKGKTKKGEAQFGLELDGSSSTKLDDVLSEGELRVVGIACFLAELGVSASDVGMLFDDPVSSLDHRHRPAIAERLVKESISRQVIIFTHDIAFLNELNHFAEKVGTGIRALHLTMAGGSYGLVREGFPLEASNLKARLGVLRQTAQAIKAAKLDEELEVAALRHAYTDLRSAWERYVEEYLFAGVVQRFNPAIGTLKLDYVVVTDDDVHAVNQGMDNANRFAHDTPDPLHGPVPKLQNFEADVQALEDLRTARNKSNEAARKRRAVASSYVLEG